MAEIIDYGYDGSTEIPKEVKNVKDVFLFGLTLPQIGFISVGAGAAYGGYKLGTLIGIDSMAPLIAIVFAIPFIVAAFFTINGLSSIEFVLMLFSNHFRASRVRIHREENLYEGLERAAYISRKAENKGVKKQKLKKRAKSVHVAFK